ncbi:uncharacterized protein N7496_002960 [Penicillium cataractarum]|uniref:Uncharacterized protein n=1 Tax=Penicillium cataractarum TaxID=2100454 RepID=A0A9W9VFY6_9EURO|nr:uncharacterized protein N7496_002960 [Penicillium cataractarum]KAJ5380532.1 hypothetical protein N7496_002960 [Penicillium cataractarum]
MILLVVPTVRAEVGRVEHDKGSSEDGGVVSTGAYHDQAVGQTPKPLDVGKDITGSQSKRVAIIGGGIGGISTAHFLINDNNRPNLTQITIFEKKPQFGGRIHFTRIYDHGTTVNTASHTFDADDTLIEEMTNVTSIELQKWPHDGWNTESRSFLHWMNKVIRGKAAGCSTEEQSGITWMELARLLRRNVADFSFWRKYLGYVRLAFMENAGLNRWERRIDDCGKRTNPLLLAGSQAAAGQGVELRSRIALSDELNGNPQKQLQWNQHDRIFTGLLGDLYDNEQVTMHLDSAVTRVTSYGNRTFGVYWAQTRDDGTQKLHTEQFDNVIIATPFHQAELEIEPPLPLEPEKITYAPVHVTSLISQSLPESLLLQSHGERWRTTAAFLWPAYFRHRNPGLNTTSIPLISVARERTVCYDYDSRPHDLTRVISADLFSDDDIAALFHEAHENVTFPRQSCFVPQQAQPDLVHPKYHKIRDEFALENGAVNRSSRCVERPTIAWIHRDYWPNGLPVITQGGKHGNHGEWRELVPGMFYVNGFEGREGASVSNSIASGRKVKDMLVARYAAG